jgi:hypothetical protein
MALSTPTVSATADDANARVALSVTGSATPAVPGLARASAAATGFNFSGANDLTFNVQVDGGSIQAVSVTSDVSDIAGLVTALDADITGATVSHVSGVLVITSATTGAASNVSISTLVDGGGGNATFLAEGSNDGSAAPEQRFVVERTEDSGTTWTEVRGVSLLVPDGSYNVATYDYEAPCTGTAGYRAKAIDAYNGYNTDSSWSSTDTETVAVSGWWLQDLEVPALNSTLPVERAVVTYDKTRDQGVFLPLGRDRAVVVYGDRRGETVTLPIMCVGDTSYDALEALLDGGRTLLLRTADGRRLYVANPDKRAAAVQPTADWSERPVRKFNLSFTEVDVP